MDDAEKKTAELIVDLIDRHEMGSLIYSLLCKHIEEAQSNIRQELGNIPFWSGATWALTNFYREICSLESQAKFALESAGRIARAKMEAEEAQYEGDPRPVSYTGGAI